MTNTKTRLRERASQYLPKLRGFFEGNLYPLLVAAAVLIGHVTALEFYFFILIVLAASTAFLICDTAKPFIPTALTFVYLVNLKHSPGFPTWSDYYSKTYVTVTAVIMFSILFISAVYFIARRVAPRLSFKKTPLLLPLTLLSAAFLANGAFSSAWKPINLIFGLAEAAVFFLLFYLFYYGFEKENINKLIDYICYVSLLVAVVLIGEVIFMYTTNPEILNSDGAILKNEISLGWGISNPIGNALVILIPTLMLGAVKCKHAPVYLIASLLTCFATLLTLSRNAIIVCALVFTASFITVYILSDSKKLLCTVLGCGICIALITLLIFRNSVAVLFNHFYLAGATSSGRIELWKESIKKFIEAPIFGKGFFGWNEADFLEMASFLPTMSHNTFFQLISSMGIFGLAAYAFYRVKSLLPFFKRISREKLMLLYSVLALLAGSLLDNFLFYFHSAFLYVILLALVFRMNDYEEEWIRTHAFDDELDLEDEDEDDSEDDDDYYI